MKRRKVVLRLTDPTGEPQFLTLRPGDRLQVTTKFSSGGGHHEVTGHTLTTIECVSIEREKSVR